MSARPPVIVIGMHRSGTSMVVRLLEELGLFAGKRKDKNDEALFFLKLNDWLLRQSGGAWDHPEPVKHLLDNAGARSLAVDYIRHLMKTPRAASYLGWDLYLQYRGLQKLDFSWGWKDPRNTYTLPLWLDLFPEARVIHLRRHGVDVASSLKVREDRILARSAVLHDRRKALYWLHPKRQGFLDSPRCASLEGGFSLWEDYTEEAERQISWLGDRATTLKYEDFLAEPQETLTSLLRFCGLSATEGDIEKVSKKVNRGRAYAYRNDPELSTIVERVARRLGRRGY